MAKIEYENVSKHRREILRQTINANQLIRFASVNVIITIIIVNRCSCRLFVDMVGCSSLEFNWARFSFGRLLNFQSEQNAMNLEKEKKKFMVKYGNKW